MGLLLTDCSRKMIDVQSSVKQPYFVLEMEKADLYFSKEDVLQEAKSEIENEKKTEAKNLLQDAYEKVKESNFDTLSFPLKLSSDVNDDLLKSSHLIVYLTFYDLLKEGQVRVYNKQTNKFEDKVSYKYEKPTSVKGEKFFT
ncbi:MAG: hypothetical protein HC880_06380 [Bacteroidia bacterium]|nr:hypothetical protein [Bacteroidia bacterium]